MGCVQSNAEGNGECVESVPSASASRSSGNQAPRLAFREAYSLGQGLGEGAFGQVRRGQHLATKVSVAVKVLDAERRMNSGRLSTPHTPRGDPNQKENNRRNNLGVEGRGAQQGSNSTRPSAIGSSLTPFSPRQHKDPLTKFRKAVSQEVAMLKLIGRHQHCIQFMDFYEEQGICYIVTELCNATLLEYLNETPLDSVPELQRIFKEMALGVAYVHEIGLMHRDIKPANFLVGGEDGKIIKLADFGAAVEIPKDRSLRHTIFGTAPYMSPEMLSDEGYDQITDIWSLGTAYYEILFGELPYCPNEREPAKLKAAILFGVPEPSFRQAEQRGFAQGVPKLAEDLVKSCLDRDPTVRPSAVRVVRHSFLCDAKVHEPLSGKAFDLSTLSLAESDASTAVPTSRSSELDAGSRKPSKLDGGLARGSRRRSD